MSLNYTYMHAIGSGFPEVQCHCVGDPNIYENIVLDGAVPLPTIAELDAWISNSAKTDMWKLIQSERDRRKAGGVKVGTDWFHSDDSSRIQQLGLLMMGANMPSNVMWKTIAGTFVQMTPTLAGQIFQSVAASDMTIFAVAEQKKAEMTASADPANYSYLTGWPKIYGE